MAIARSEDRLEYLRTCRRRMVEIGKKIPGGSHHAVAQLDAEIGAELTHHCELYEGFED